jgi:deoxyribodipyrimidine photo-lyase
LKLEQSISPVTRFFRGGTGEAEKLFHSFLAERLATSTGHRNQPQTEDVSHMSKYLHFGQISPTWLALEARKHSAAAATTLRPLSKSCSFAANSPEFRPLPRRLRLLRELARVGAPDADRTSRRSTAIPLQGAPNSKPPKRTIRIGTPRCARCGTPATCTTTCACIRAKRSSNGARRPEAFAAALAINNRYFLDGRHANSFANIKCVFGQHDSPWGERPIFGKVRYMNAHGLERKCDIKAYISKVERLTGDFRGG